MRKGNLFIQTNPKHYSDLGSSCVINMEFWRSFLSRRRFWQGASGGTGNVVFKFIPHTAILSFQWSMVPLELKLS